jgi:uncharacterized protein (TIGR03790 family)
MWNLGYGIFRCLSRLLFLISLLTASAAPAIHSPGEVLLVYNSNSPASSKIAGYYKAKRGITNVIAISCPDSALNQINENISLANYTSQIEKPIRNYLSSHAGINFIVLCKGMPLRISGTDVGWINNDDYTYYNGINLGGATSFSARVANPNSAGAIQIRLDSPTGTLIGTCPVAGTGGFQTWTTSTCSLTSTSGIHNLYLVYSGGFNIEWFSLSNSPRQIQATSYSGKSESPLGQVSSEGGATTTGSEPVGQLPHSYTPSVDAYLAAMDYSTANSDVPASITGNGIDGVAWINKYYNSTVPFTHSAFGGYLVTRLDGYTEADAIALIDNSLAGESHPGHGPILLDVEPDFGVGDKTREPFPTPSTNVTFMEDNSFENSDMLQLGDLLEANGIPNDVAITNKFVGNRTNLMGYFSWGSNDNHFNQRAYNSLRFEPGAIGQTEVSTAARSFFPQTEGQSMMADIIAQGITGMEGTINEPLCEGDTFATIDFAHYLTGYTMAESFYAGMPYLGWENIVVGDPLCCPYFNAGNHLITPTQASSYSSSAGGVRTENCNESALNLGSIQNACYTAYTNITLDGITSFVARVASASSGGNIQIRLDGPTGRLIGTCSVPVTGNWQNWKTETCTIAATVGFHNIYLVYTGGDGYLFNLEWFAFKP